MYLVEGFRTPFCKFGTDLADEPVHHLGLSPTKAVLTATGIDTSVVDEVIFGCCYQPSTTIGNIARTISVRAGIPETVPAVTVHRNCASGLEAVTYACDKAAAGKGDVFIAGGVESMSQAPFLFNKQAVKKFTNLSRAKTLWQKLGYLNKFRPSDFTPEVSLKLAMVDNLVDMSMGNTAELLAREYNVSRVDQDLFAETSHLRSLAAKACGRFKEEIAPLYPTNDDCIRSPKGKVILEDNGPRNDSFVDKLSKLRTVFERDGTVTAGNSSQVTDGGAAMLLMTDVGLRKTGCTPIARIIDYAYSGCDPKRMGLGPVNAVMKLADSNETFRIQNMDLVEINEAFAAQVLACLEHLDIPRDKLNVNGGAIAIGHPLAASGARLVIGLAKELRHRNAKQGVASLCVGGGQGGAIWVESM